MLQAALPPSRQAGGVGYQVDLLARALCGRGHDVTVFVAESPPALAPYRCVQVAAGSGRVRRVLGVGWAFSRLDLRDHDVVHAHGDDWLFGRRPRVRTFYGTALMEARAATRLTRRAAQLCYYGLEWVSSANRHSLAISETTRRYLPLVRSSIPCAVDGAAFHPGGERTSEPSILFVAGTLKGRKRGDLLLRAFAEVRSVLADARLTIVCPEAVTAPGVTCRSALAADELGALYRSHWLLCSTSSYEGFGVPYVEALASGLPVVTTANDGAQEVLRGGELGVISSPDALAGDLVALLGDASRRDALSAAGVKAAATYSVDRIAERYEQVYVGTVGRARSRGGLSVLAVSPVAEAGGAENLLLDVLAGQQSAGADVTLLALGLGPLAGLAEARGVAALSGPALSFRSPGSIAGAAGAVRRAVKAARPDVVLASHPKGQVINRLAMVGDRTLAHVTQLYDPPSDRSVSTRVAARLRGVRLSITEETAAAYRALNPRLDPIVIPPGTDGDRLRCDADRGDPDGAWLEAGLEGAGPRVVMVGRLQRFKGPFDFVAAAARVVAARPDTRFLVIGPDSPIEPGLRQDLERDIAVRGLGSSVALAGRLAADDLAATVAGATLVVHPAHREPFGLAVVEALALGTPVVAYATTGPAAILVAGGGALVPVGDVAALAEAVRGALDDPSVLDRWRAEGPRTAERFDVARTVPRYREALEAAARLRPRGGPARPAR